MSKVQAPTRPRKGRAHIQRKRLRSKPTAWRGAALAPSARGALALARALTLRAIEARGWTAERLSASIIVCDVTQVRRPVVHLVTRSEAREAPLEALRQAGREARPGFTPIVVLAAGSVALGSVRRAAGGAS